MTERVGQQLGNYQLLQLLGRGSFADVYLGEHIHLKELAAIKLLSTRLTDDLQENFLHEAHILARLSHPHIIRVLEFGLDEAAPYLAMNYAPGGTLRQRHPHFTKLPIEIVLDYVRQIADGLQYAHDQKLIHRDLKPDNLLIGENGNLLLSDFGVALIVQTSLATNVETNFAGTASYMAPEQLQGKPQFASDQYALGIMVYEWLCGTRPFHGSLPELYSQHSSVSPAPLREHDPDLAPAVEEVVLRALAKDPDQRFGSVRDFACALEQTCQFPQAIGSFEQPALLAGSPEPVFLPPSPGVLQLDLVATQSASVDSSPSPEQFLPPAPVSFHVDPIMPEMITPQSDGSLFHFAAHQNDISPPQQVWNYDARLPMQEPSFPATRASHLSNRLSNGKLLLFAGLAVLLILGASLASLSFFNLQGKKMVGHANGLMGQDTSDNLTITPTITPLPQPSPTTNAAITLHQSVTPTPSPVLSTPTPKPIPPTATSTPQSQAPSSTPSKSNPRPDLAGARVQAVNSPAVYLIDVDGYLRWIPDPTTYNNLFRDWNGIQQLPNVGTISMKAPLTSGAYLAQSPTSPKVYLITNGKKQWITSRATMDKFYFSWSTIKQVPDATLQAIPDGANIS